MDIEEFRNYCLSMDKVTEKMPFGKFARRYDSIADMIPYWCSISLTTCSASWILTILHLLQ